MVDMIDRSQIDTDLMLERSLENRARFDKESLNYCEECGEEIPLVRKQLGSVTRCFECQSVLEKKKNNGIKR